MKRPARWPFNKKRLVPGYHVTKNRKTLSLKYKQSNIVTADIDFSWNIEQANAFTAANEVNMLC